jgi:hypothetical protein
MARSRRWQLARAASNCGAIATLSTFLGSVTLRGGLLGRIPSINELGGLSMTIDSVTPIEQTMAITDVLATNDVRTLVAKHLGVSVDRVTDEAHFKLTKHQKGCDEVALVFLRLGGDAMRNLIGWCPETRQPIDLHLYVDDATLSRIWCKPIRFQCPHCGIKHETKVERLASKPLSLEPPQTKRTRHQKAARLFARAS